MKKDNRELFCSDCNDFPKKLEITAWEDFCDKCGGSLTLKDRGPRKYPVIYMDPPWKYPKRDPKKKFGKGASNHYPMMSLAQLQAMKPQINEWAVENCALFMWVTGPRIPWAVYLFNAWEFRYSTLAFTWIKVNKNGTYFKGPGNYTGSNTELVLLGVRGSMRPKVKLVEQVVITGRLPHSVKPEIVRQRIMGMYNGPYLEVFGRRAAEGWDVTGLDVDGKEF